VGSSYSTAARPATKPTTPVSGFATPAAAPGELEEDEFSIVCEEDSVSVLEAEDSVAVPVDAALSLLRASLASLVELGRPVGAGPIATSLSATHPRALDAGELGLLYSRACRRCPSFPYIFVMIASLTTVLLDHSKCILA
jgi:hypothetical protein